LRRGKRELVGKRLLLAEDERQMNDSVQLGSGGPGYLQKDVRLSAGISRTGGLNHMAVHKHVRQLETPVSRSQIE